MAGATPLITTDHQVSKQLLIACTWSNASRGCLTFKATLTIIICRAGASESHTPVRQLILASTQPVCTVLSDCSISRHAPAIPYFVPLWVPAPAPVLQGWRDVHSGRHRYSISPICQVQWHPVLYATCKASLAVPAAQHQHELKLAATIRDAKCFKFNRLYNS